jgi:8-amino-7-oxononanoate synthase
LFAKCAAFDGPRHAQAVGVYPFFRVIQSAQDPEVTINGRTLVMLGSNNYLGLATDPRVKEAAADAIRRYGTGCCGSRLLNGTLDIHVEFERKLAAFTGKEAAAIFSTGAQVNLGVIACLVDRGDAVYVDKLDHGCIIDGARLAFGETWKFRHNCLDDLRRLMAAGDARGRLVVVEGVFSMEGDIAPLPGIVEIAREFHAAVMVDDAHGIGVLGENGRGTAEHFGVEGQIDLVMGTFSKSLASNGGFVSGGADVINFIRHKARTHIFTAAPVPASVAAASAALDIIGQEPERRELLWRNTRFLSGGLKSLGFDTGNSQTPIIPVIIGEEYRAGAVAMRLQENGVFVNPVVWPATPKGRALIRTSCMATHSEGQLSRALDAFQAVGREFGLIGQ